MKKYNELIDNAETVYNTCWSILCDFKNHTVRQNNTDITQFQIRLAKTLFKLEKEVLLISQKINIDKKANNDLLISEKQRLTRCINIGKAIGDCFIWIFYVKNLDLLEKHQVQKSNGPSPATKGIFAEILFLETYQVSTGYLYLYHGITNSYRLGDFSIFEIASGTIVGIVELKTKSFENNKVLQEVNVIFATSLSQDFINTFTNKEISIATTKNSKPAADERKERQLAHIAKEIKSIHELPSLRIDADNNFSFVNDLAKHLQKNKFGLSISQLAPYMLSVSLRTRKRKLSTILSENIDRTIELSKLNLEKKVECILNKEWDNKIFVSGFLYDEKNILLHPGIQPLFWQINDLSVAKQLYFSQITVTTIYNPGYFHNLMIKNGWIYSNNDDYYYKKENGKTKEIHGIESFSRMMCCFYVTDDYIIETIEKALRVAQETATETEQVKAEIHFKMS